jgi:hypothetical protein
VRVRGVFLQEEKPRAAACMSAAAALHQSAVLIVGAVVFVVEDVLFICLSFCWFESACFCIVCDDIFMIT